MSGAPASGTAIHVRSQDVALMLAAVVLLPLLVHGYSWELGAENQPLQVPLIERLADPALYPGDPLVAALAKYRSIFFPAAAAVRPWTRLEPAFLAVHLGTTALAAAAMWALTRHLTRRRTAALLAALLLITSPVIRPTELGRDTIVATWVTPTTLSFPVLLLALHLFLEGRAGLAGVMAGLAAQVNLVAAGLFMIVVLPVALCEPRARRVGFAARLAAAFALAAAPALVAAPGHAFVPGRGLDFIQLLRHYYPYHFFLAAHRPGVALRLAILVAAAVVGFRALPATDAVRRARRLMIAVAVAIGAGGFFADLFPVAAVVQLHLLRADRWFYVILIAAASAAIARAAALDPEPAAGPAAEPGAAGALPARRWCLAAALALLAGLLRGAYPLVGWGALVLLLEPRARDERPLGFHLPALPAIAAVIGAAAVAEAHLWERGFRASFGLGILVVVLGLAAGPRLLAALRAHRHAALALVGAIALLEFAHWNGTLGPRGLALARPVFRPEWREVQEWAARSTPVEARFLTPPEYAGFRVYARRSTVVEWKDGAAMLWDPAFGPGWWARRAAVDRAMSSGSAELLMDTARRYGAGWVVVPVEHAPPALAPVHENPRFKVYAVPSP